MRADSYLAFCAYTKSRQQAKNMIEAGCVLIDGRKIVKPSESIDELAEHEVELTRTDKFVSRGGYKLEAALECFGIDVYGMCAVDIGASTGGFTDCLLSRGAEAVFAVDSGEGQLDARLRCDPRVRCIEQFNARVLCDGVRGELPADAGIVVMDVSFISQTYIIPGIPNILAVGGLYVGLIKPQFEAGRAGVGKNGIVKDKKFHASSILRVAACAESVGFGCLGVIRSPIEGGDGNTEYLAAFRLGADCPPVTEDKIRALIAGDGKVGQ